jgi:hypothetical protein
MSVKAPSVQSTLLVLACAWGAGCVLLVGWGGYDPLLVAALAAVGIGVLGLLPAVRARSALRAARRAALLDARDMLQDRLSSHLHHLVRVATLPDRELDGPERARLGQVVHAAREVESALELLSETSVEAWKRSESLRQGEESRSGEGPGKGVG